MLTVSCCREAIGYAVRQCGWVKLTTADESGLLRTVLAERGFSFPSFEVRAFHHVTDLPNFQTFIGGRKRLGAGTMGERNAETFWKEMTWATYDGDVPGMNALRSVGR